MRELHEGCPRQHLHVPAPANPNRHDRAADRAEGEMHVVGVARELGNPLRHRAKSSCLRPSSRSTGTRSAATERRRGTAPRRGRHRGVAPRRERVLGGAPVLDLHATSRRIDTTLEVERRLLLAGASRRRGILVSQALGRSASTIGDDARTLRRSACPRRPRRRHGAVPCRRGGGGGAAAFAVAVGLSSRFPVGFGRRVDPNVGTRFDWSYWGRGRDHHPRRARAAFLLGRRGSDRARFRRVSQLGPPRSRSAGGLPSAWGWARRWPSNGASAGRHAGGASPARRRRRRGRRDRNPQHRRRHHQRPAHPELAGITWTPV